MTEFVAGAVSAVCCLLAVGSLAALAFWAHGQSWPR